MNDRKGLVSDGGRVIHVVGVGDTKVEAIARAYGNIEKVQFEGMRYRDDIGLIYNYEEVLQDADYQRCTQHCCSSSFHLVFKRGSGSEYAQGIGLIRHIPPRQCA